MIQNQNKKQDNKQLTTAISDMVVVASSFYGFNLFMTKNPMSSIGFLLVIFFKNYYIYIFFLDYDCCNFWNFKVL